MTHGVKSKEGDSQLPNGYPQTGDVVVRTHSAGRHTLSMFGEEPQILARGIEPLRDLARRYAASRGIDSWQTRDDVAFTILASHR